MENGVVTYIIFFAVAVPSMIFAINFSKIMYVEILKVVAGKSAKVFRYLTCGTWDITTFKALHLNYDDDVKSDDETFDIKEAPPKEEHLLGFGAEDNEHSSALKHKIEMRRRRLLEVERNERLQDEGFGLKKESEESSLDSS